MFPRNYSLPSHLDAYQIKDCCACGAPLEAQSLRTSRCSYCGVYFVRHVAQALQTSPAMHDEQSDESVATSPKNYAHVPYFEPAFGIVLFVIGCGLLAVLLLLLVVI